MTTQAPTIRTKLQALCECHGFAFFFDTWNRANRKLETELRERAVYPAALMISTSSGAFQSLPSGTHRQEDIVLALFEPTERDNTEVDISIQERMIDRASGLITAISGAGLEIVGDAVRYSPFTDRLDENVAGIALTMTVRDLTPEECKP